MLGKKIAMALIASATVACAQQATMGIVGVTRISKPALALSLVGNNFGDTTSTLNEIAPITQFNGSTLFANADRVYIWDPEIPGYSLYLLYDDGSIHEWRDIADFFKSNGSYPADPVIPAGAAFWVESAGSTVDSDLFVYGEVVAKASVTNQIVVGLQQLCYPFSQDVELNSISLKENASGSTLFAGADRVYAWDVGAQTYKLYLLFDNGMVREWRAIGDFFNSNPAFTPDPIPLKLGQGFWYEAVGSDFVWIESNNYIDYL
jgi:hypothetical protein